MNLIRITVAAYCDGYDTIWPLTPDQVGDLAARPCPTCLMRDEFDAIVTGATR